MCAFDDVDYHKKATVGKGKHRWRHSWQAMSQTEELQTIQTSTNCALKMPLGKDFQKFLFERRRIASAYINSLEKVAWKACTKKKKKKVGLQACALSGPLAAARPAIASFARDKMHTSPFSDSAMAVLPARNNFSPSKAVEYESAGLCSLVTVTATLNEYDGSLWVKSSSVTKYILLIVL